MQFDYNHPRGDVCICGHAYYRHFEAYEGPHRCKYCGCTGFVSIGPREDDGVHCVVPGCRGETKGSSTTCSAHQADHGDGLNYRIAVPAADAITMDGNRVLIADRRQACRAAGGYWVAYRADGEMVMDDDGEPRRYVDSQGAIQAFGLPTYPDGHATITADAARRYVEASGLACPYCGCRSLVAGPLSADGPAVESDVTCDRCDRVWSDVYALTGIRAARR